MRSFVVLMLLFNSTFLFAKETVLIAILSSVEKPEKMGENFHDNDSEGWDDIESHIRFGSQLFASRYCAKEVVLKDYDTKNTIEGTIKAIQAAEADGAKAIIGFVASSSILTINKLLPNRKIPIITLTATHNDVPRKNPPTLQLSYNDKVQGTALGETVLRIPKSYRKHILLLTDATNPFSAGLSHQTKEYLAKHGQTVTEFEYASPLRWFPHGWSISDFEKATAIVMTGEGKEVLEVVTHLSPINKNYMLIGGDGWYRGNVTQYAPGPDLFIPDTITLGHWAPRFTDKNSQEFAKAYREKFKSNPGGIAAAAHDAVKLVCETLNKKGKVTFDSFVGMESSGLTGTIHFDGSGRQAIKKPVIYWFKNGGYHDERL